MATQSLHGNVIPLWFRDRTEAVLCDCYQV